jgi:hypothetical protein
MRRLPSRTTQTGAFEVVSLLASMTVGRSTVRWYVLAAVGASFLAVLSCAPYRKVNLQPTSSARLGFKLCEAPYGPSKQAGFGSSADLKGLTKVFVDVFPRVTTEKFKDVAAAAAEGHRTQILTALSLAKLPLVLVSRRDEAEVVLASCTDSRKPRCTFATSSSGSSDLFFGDVYVVSPVGLRLVMRYSDQCTLYTRELGKGFAEAFVQAYQKAK